MDNKYTFKDFLADLKKWQSENLVEYYRFLGLLGLQVNQGKSLGVFKYCLLDERDFASRNRNAFGAKLHDELHAS